ncbi:hypothetical protein [Odoribacter lunatus]|uniref:hypothetical protein n=1 Tax=Odoribacter lunatus TaxID=2941335 RepID=UPI00203B785B|nr:hypothetical protein [Odoribacter lunatus]
MEQWKNHFFHCSIFANFLLPKIKDMFSTQKEYVFDAKRGSFLHEKDMFFQKGYFWPKRYMIS